MFAQIEFVLQSAVAFQQRMRQLEGNADAGQRRVRQSASTSKFGVRRPGAALLDIALAMPTY